MHKQPILWFYLLAFGISWVGWVPAVLGSQGVQPFDNPAFQSLLILAGIGPMLAAVIVTQATYGSARVGALFKALFQGRASLVWYVAALLLPGALVLSGHALTQLLNLPVSAQVDGRLEPAVMIPALVSSLIANPLEEIGWRGFALPHWQRRYSALVASLIVGVLWGAWHLPLFFWVGNPMSTYPFLPWFVGLLAQTVLYTWLYNSTGGSLLFVSLFHVVLNTAGAVISGVSVLGLAAVCILAALVVALTFGGVNLSRRPRMRAMS